MKRALIVVAIILCCLQVAPVRATLHLVVRHTIDSTEVGLDTSPPARPSFKVKEIRRGVGERQQPDGTWVTTSGDDVAGVEFVVETRDDRSKRFEIGYRLTRVDGLLPEGLSLPEEAYRTLGCGGPGTAPDCLYFLHWLEDPIDFQAPFDFTITAVAIDKAGNESEPSNPVRVTHGGVTIDEVLTAAVDSIAAAAVDAGPIAGLSVAVYRGRKPVHVRGYGFARVAENLPAGSHTVYDLASVSKLFTAIAILRMVDSGALRLDDPIGRWLPSFPNPAQAERITIRHLLNHTSGLSDYEDVDTERWLTEGLRLTPKFVFDYLRDRPLDFEPGSRWSYSNTGFYLAALIIEKVTGRPYGEHMRELLGFRTMGLRDSGPCDGTSRARAAGYDASEGNLAAGQLYMVPGIIGDGGLCSTAFELARLPWILANVRVLSGPALEEMMTPTQLAGGVHVDYGLGVRMGTLDGHRLWGHTGGMGTYWSVLAHYPDDDLTIVVLVNTDNAAEDALTIEGRIARVALGLDDPALKDLRLPREEARVLEGWFEDYSGRVRMFRSADRLMREREGSGSPATTLRYQGRGVFARDDYPMDRMVFHLQRGRAEGISEYYNGMFVTFLKPVRE